MGVNKAVGRLFPKVSLWLGAKHRIKNIDYRFPITHHTSSSTIPCTFFLFHYGAHIPTFTFLIPQCTPPTGPAYKMAHFRPSQPWNPEMHRAQNICWSAAPRIIRGFCSFRAFLPQWLSSIHACVLATLKNSPSVAHILSHAFTIVAPSLLLFIFFFAARPPFVLSFPAIPIYQQIRYSIDHKINKKPHDRCNTGPILLSNNEKTPVFIFHDFSSKRTARLPDHLAICR